MGSCLRATAVTFALLAMLTVGCRVQHASDDHAKQQIFYQASLGDPRTFGITVRTKF